MQTKNNNNEVRTQLLRTLKVNGTNYPLFKSDVDAVDVALSAIIKNTLNATKLLEFVDLLQNTDLNHMVLLLTEMQDAYPGKENSKKELKHLMSFLKGINH